MAPATLERASLTAVTDGAYPCVACPGRRGVGHGELIREESRATRRCVSASRLDRSIRRDDDGLRA